MATSKTLAPTNVTISIPAMTDAPNASVISNCLDKEADAINALNSQKSNKVIVSFTTTSGNNVFTLAANSRLLMFSADSNAGRCGMWIVFSTGGGVTGVVPVLSATGITVTEGTGQITFNSQGTPNVTFINMYNDSPATNYVSKQ